MEIRIALNNIPGIPPGTVSDDHRCGYLTRRNVDRIRSLGAVMPNRDANITTTSNMTGDTLTLIPGHIESWTIEPNKDNDRPELVISIKTALHERD